MTNIKETTKLLRMLAGHVIQKKWVPPLLPACRWVKFPQLWVGDEKLAIGFIIKQYFNCLSLHSVVPIIYESKPQSV